MKKVSLLKIGAGKRGKIEEVLCSRLAHRLMSLGVYPGREITKISHFGLRGPVTIMVGRNKFAVSHDMAGKIILAVE